MTASQDFQIAERQVMDELGIAYRSSYVALAEPKIQARVIEIGEGEPLVLVHGGGSFASSFAPLLPYLPGRRLILADRPGCGLSDRFDYTGVNLRSHGVAFLASLLDALELERAAFLGNSMGGLWSLWLALERPERVDSLVMAGCPALMAGTGAPFSMRLMAIPPLNALLRRQAPTLRSLEGMMASLGERSAWSQTTPAFRQLVLASHRLPGYGEAWFSLIRDTIQPLRPWARQRWRFRESELQRLRARVLFIWGGRDPFGRVAAAENACRLIPKADLAIVPDGGHLPWLIDPPACGHAVEAFLGKAVSA
jgi:pimeloyl-ACP methyl ester carboxylesterase